MAAQSLGKLMGTISKVERMKALTFERLKACESRAMLESMSGWLLDQVQHRQLKRFIFQDILKVQQLTFI
jgi:hypothetical protein